MQKYFRCISNADNKFKICETSRCKKFWRFDDIGKSCLNLIIIQRSPSLRSYTGVLSSTPFSLLTAQKKINLHAKVICMYQNVGKWHGSNRRCTYFRVFSLYLNYINEKDTLYKKNLSIQYFEMCNDEFIDI